MPIDTAHLGPVWYALEWVIRIGAVVVVPQRRAPAPAAGWLLLILFQPAIGVLAFLAIGSARFPAWRQRRFRAVQPYFHAVADGLGANVPPGDDETGPVDRLTRTLGGFPAVGGNTVEMIDDYDAVIARLVADIDGAVRSVDILVYIFADDAVGLQVIEALDRARKRGVACRVMLDPVGSHAWRKGAERRLRAADVEVCEALPFRLGRTRSRRDMRNHRKLIAIDGQIGYAGSQNIVAKDFRPGVVNRELVVRLTGPAVAAIVAVIAGDWFIETQVPPPAPASPPPATGGATVQLLPSGANYPLEGFETLLVWQLHAATTRAVVVSPYFIPDDALLEAMRTAAARGVEIHLVVSQVVDQRFVNLAQCSYYDALLAAGVRIHLFRDFLLHAKNVGIDGRLAIVGSSNVDLRSFQLNEEASLLLHDAASVAAVEAVQRGYLAGSTELVRSDWAARPHLRRIAENVARLVSPLL